MILVEQVDRLSRLSDVDCDTIKRRIFEKELSVISLDPPAYHIALTHKAFDELTKNMIRAVNGRFLDIIDTIDRKDYEDRRRR